MTIPKTKNRDTTKPSLFTLCCLAALLITASTGAAAISASAANLSYAAGNTRLSLDFPVAVKYKIFTLNEPNRLVIDLEGVDPASALKRLPAKLSAKDANIAGIRVARFTPTVTRIVLDIKGALPDVKSSSHPIGKRGQRLTLQWPTRLAEVPTPIRLAKNTYAASGVVSVPGVASVSDATNLNENKLVPPVNPPPPAITAATATPVTTPAPLKFEIREFKVEGNTLLPAGEISRLVTPYTGQSRDFGDVQRALEALQDAYQKLGYNSVQVLLPEQELEHGSVRLKVVEQRIARISIEGNEVFDDANVMRALPSITKGSLPNIKEIQATLHVANENPAKQTAILFKNSEDDESTIDATVKVVESKPWKAFLTLDNTGSKTSGYGRLGFGYQHYNLFNMDHRVTAQYQTTPHYPWNLQDPVHGVNIIGLGYTIPLYDWDDSLDLIAAYSDSSSGLIQDLIDVKGKGVVLGIHYNYNFDKIGNYEHKLIPAFDYRGFRTDTSVGDTNLTPHVTSSPFSLTYAGTWQANAQRISFSLGSSWNVPVFEHSGAVDFGGPDANGNLNSYRAENNFRKFNYSLDYFRSLPKDWQLHLALSGQFTHDHLYSGEQFRAGGAETVRGFHESAISGDKGYLLSAEVISPNFGKAVGDKVDLRSVVFFDRGHISYVNDVVHLSLINESTGVVPISIASVGTGLRASFGQSAVARADYAVVIEGDTRNTPLGSTSTVGSRVSGDKFLHVSFGWIW